jgi:glucan phosphorylase
MLRKEHISNAERVIAYFSTEIGIDAEMPTHSGGLGVLAGDTIRSAADLNLPMVALTLLHRKGYFYQRISADGWQTEEPVEWVVDDYMQEMPEKASVTIDGRTVVIRPWKFEVKGVGGFNVSDGNLNMARLAFNMSRYVNGVVNKHGEISKLMLAEYDINSITNGMHRRVDGVVDQRQRRRGKTKGGQILNGYRSLG